MKSTRLFVAVLALVASPALLTPSAYAADAPPGAASCSGCHAANAGVANPIPRLIGRNAAETAAAMIAFKTGKQSATVMDRIAKGFSDDEIRAIAAWYSG